MSIVRGFETSAVRSDLFTIRIQHMPSQAVVEFSGYVTEFSDQYASTWNTETVYGRMDPLATFQNTQRSLSLNFDVPSGDFQQAEDNLRNIDRLTQFLYPVYNEGSRAQQNTLKAGPLIGLRFSNLISNAGIGDDLLGYLNGVNYAPDLNQGGFFRPGDNPDGFGRGGAVARGLYVPKVVSISLQYTVLHKHLTGWADVAGKRAGAKMTFGGAKKIDRTFPRMGSAIESVSAGQASSSGVGSPAPTSTTAPTGTPAGGGNTVQTQNAAAGQVTGGGGAGAGSSGGLGAGLAGSDPTAPGI